MAGSHAQDRGVSASSQASFEDLGTHLSEVTFCVVDLETTGGAETDSITEFGAVKVRGGEVQGEFQTLVNPRIHIPPLIAALGALARDQVDAGHGSQVTDVLAPRGQQRRSAWAWTAAWACSLARAPTRTHRP